MINLINLQRHIESGGYFGSDSAQVQTEVNCPSCLGFGYAQNDVFTYNCKRCNGTGKERALPNTEMNLLAQLVKWISEESFEDDNEEMVIRKNDLLNKIEELKQTK